MFCHRCGTPAPNAARFCPACGTQIANFPSPTAPPTAPSIASQQSTLSSTPTPTPPTSPLLSPSGHPQRAFEALADAIFDGLDRNVHPKRTGGLEVSKLTAWRIYGGTSIPPFYGTHVLPTYISVMGIDTVPRQPHNAPIITPRGWRHFLLQKLQADPEWTFAHLVRLLPALGIRAPLCRADFPAAPDSAAEARDQVFRAQVSALASRAFAGGAMMGFGTGMVGTVMAGQGYGSGGDASVAAVQAMTDAVAQNSANILNNMQGGASGGLDGYPWPGSGLDGSGFGGGGLGSVLGSFGGAGL